MNNSPARVVWIIFANTCLFAYCCGFVERARFGDGFGRTHDTNQDWNESYDSGANLADRLMGWSV